MFKRPIYTIGHGCRKIEDFLVLLQRYRIKYLVDIRSRPYSRFNPQFNQHSLKSVLEENSITYVFMGDTLGGRPADVSCYNNHGKVDYDVVKQKDFFIKGINRLRTASDKDICIALMCSESKPQDCHRSRLVGNALVAGGVTLAHIDETGIIKEHDIVIGEVYKGIKGIDLFANVVIGNSRKTHI